MKGEMVVDVVEHDNRTMRRRGVNAAAYDDRLGQGDLYAEYAEEKDFLSRPAVSFSQAAWAHVERIGIGRKEFCEKTLLSEKTYERLRDGEVLHPSLQTVLQVCVGLGLGGVFGEQLLDLAGYKLSAQQLPYKKILCSYRGHSIYECDEILVALGMPSIIPKQYRATG
jgi:hypothetical protein